ncbi:MAG: CopY family transcriptional regulator, partial [Caulobacteraceae bacterium]
MIDTLPRREREVFETLCRLEAGTASAVRADLSDALSDSAVRTMLRRLEAKGLVRREAGQDGFLYCPVAQTDAVAAGVLRRMVDTFFAGSAAGAATALLGLGQHL